MNKNLIKGILFVAIGASSYGMVAVFIKKGIADGFSTSELVFAQALMGAIFMFLLNLVTRGFVPIKKKDMLMLMLGGLPLALTSTFYYLSLQYVPVSVCIVMLMQSVWIGVVIDFFVNKIRPTAIKLLAIFLVLIGTVLATNFINDSSSLDWRGIIWGLLAAISYSFTFLATNKIGIGYKPLLRSMYMIFGLFIVISIVWSHELVYHFDPSVLYKWGIIIAFFGTVLPPVLFTKGMPLIGVGLGGIVASMELPVSVTMAYLVLGEHVNFVQWMGIVLIIVAVIIMNLSYSKPSINKA